MLNTLGIVQVPGGQQWPQSKIGRKLGGKSLLEWVVRRVTDSQRLDGVIVVLPDTPRDRPLAELVPADVPVFWASQTDALGQFVAVLQEFRARAVVRVRANHPYVDPELIDQLVTTADMHSECDYISYCSRQGKAAVPSPLGVFAEWCSAKALRRAEREAKDAEDRDAVTRYLYTQPKQFNVRLIPVPPELDRDDLRLTIDFEEDWEHAQVIYDALDTNAWDWRRLAGLLDRQPALRERMAVLNRSDRE